MKRLFHTVLALSAAAALVLGLAACGSDDGDDDDSPAAVTPDAPKVTAAENDYTTIAVTVPANVNHVRLYRKEGGSTGTFARMYYRTFSDASASKGTYEIKDYFAQENTEYVYYYQFRTVSGDTATWSEKSEEVTATAHKGYGALASGSPAVSYDSGTSVLTFTTLPAVATELPGGFAAPQVRAYIANADTGAALSEFTVGKVGYTRNITDYLMQYADETWFGIKLKCVVYVRCRDSNGNGENYYIGSWTSDVTFTVADPRGVTPMLSSNGVPSFKVTIPSGAQQVYIARKESSAASFSTVLLVSPKSGSTFVSDSYIFTDPYVESGKTYSYRYYSSDGSANSAYSYTKNVTAEGGEGLLGATLSGTGAIDYNATTGVVTFTSVPTATLITPVSAAETFDAPTVRFCVQSASGRTVKVCSAKVGRTGDVYKCFTSGSNAGYASEFLGQAVTPLWDISGVNKQGDDVSELWYPVGTRQFTGYGLPDSITIPATASVAE